jgi:hypothetical protein
LTSQKGESERKKPTDLIFGRSDGGKDNNTNDSPKSFAHGFARVILNHVRDNLDPAPGSRNWGSELDADAEFNFFYPPLAGEGRS